MRLIQYKMEFKVVYYDNNQMRVDIVSEEKLQYYQRYSARVYPVNYKPTDDSYGEEQLIDYWSGCVQATIVPTQFKDEECPDCGKTGCRKMISWLMSNPKWLDPHPFQLK